MVRLIICATLLELILSGVSVAQQTEDTSQSGTAVCNLDDGKQITVRYNQIAVRGDGPPTGKVLVPGGAAVTLFTETDLIVGGTQVSTGAYTMYFIPKKKEWTLIVSRNVNVGAQYDEKQDLARTSMETGTLGRPEPQLRISFGHVAPKQCEIDVDYGKIRAWGTFQQR